MNGLGPGNTPVCHVRPGGVDALTGPAVQYAEVEPVILPPPGATYTVAVMAAVHKVLRRRTFSFWVGAAGETPEHGC